VTLDQVTVISDGAGVKVAAELLAIAAAEQKGLNTAGRAVTSGRAMYRNQGARQMLDAESH